MKTVLLMRHAKSSWAESGLSDHERPLNDRGEMAAARMGRLLVQQNLSPDAILHSTAARARDTARRAAKAGALSASLEARRELYLAAPEAYIAVLQALPSRVGCVLVVGHNPGLEELVTTLSGRHERMPTAALAELSLDIGEWPELGLATPLAAFRVFRPKELD
jgi:phosphohistidine phosphatase